MEIIHKYFPTLTSEQLERFKQLQPLYKEWNDKINVISRTDIDNLYERHVLHSLAIAKVINFQPDTKILDVGTGGGFPGIPLAIFFPEVQFHLVDAIGKKIKVVQEVAQAAGLKNVKAEHQRAEKLKPPYDFVTARAVTNFPKFYNWVKHLIGPSSKHTLKNGFLYLKGGDFTEELAGVPLKSKVYDIADFFDEPFFETKNVVHLYR